MASRTSPGATLALLLLCSALLAADAAVERRCTEIYEGQLEGELVALEPTLVPPVERRYTLLIPFNETCGVGGASGVVVTACDVVPPQVEMREAAGQEWGEVRVMRVGPTWLPLLLELTLFCSSAPIPPVTKPTPTPPFTKPTPTPPFTKPTPTVALTSPGSTPAPLSIPPISGPVLVPED